MCKKKNSNKVFLAGSSQIVLRDLQMDQNEDISVPYDSVSNISSDPHMDRFGFSSGTSLIFMDRRASADKKTQQIVKAHSESITSLDFNNNRQNTVLTSAYDHCLKVWDLRRCDLPVMIYKSMSNPIENARYNPVYDQLLLYSSRQS